MTNDHIDIAAAREVIGQMTQDEWTYAVYSDFAEIPEIDVRVELPNNASAMDLLKNLAGIVWLANNAAALLDAYEECQRLEGMLLACAAYVNRSVASSPEAAAMATAIMPLNEIPDAVANEIDRRKQLTDVLTRQLSESNNRNIDYAKRAGSAEGKLEALGWHGGVDAMLEKFKARIAELETQNAALRAKCGMTAEWGATDEME